MPGSPSLFTPSSLQFPNCSILLQASVDSYLSTKNPRLLAIALGPSHNSIERHVPIELPVARTNRASELDHFEDRVPSGIVRKTKCMQPNICTTQKMVSQDAVAIPEASARALAVDKPKRQKKPLPPPVYYPFWFGGSASAMAACVTHPLDLGKSCSLLSCPRGKQLRGGVVAAIGQGTRAWANTGFNS